MLKCFFIWFTFLYFKVIHGSGNPQVVKDATDAKSKIIDNKSIKNKLDDHPTKILQNQERNNDQVNKPDAYNTQLVKQESTVKNIETGNIQWKQI